MSEYTTYVGLDVHQDSITVATADGAGGAPEVYGKIPGTELAVIKLVRKLEKTNQSLKFCYEAGPCGYVIYRLLRSLGFECMVVAPSLIPQKPGEHIKNDPRDACSLARQYRAGELTGVWVPDELHESMRDLSRAREDMKKVDIENKQRLCAFLLRHGMRYSRKTRWTGPYFRWLEGLKFPLPVQQVVFQEYVDAVNEGIERVKGLDNEIRKAVDGWLWEPVVTALMALRGISFLSSFTLVAEIGDFTRFTSPVQLMVHLGLIPSEYSSGPKRWRGGITRAGNGHARRILIESSWSYRFRARKTAHIQRRAEKTTKAVQDIAWKAQKRLCGRYRHLVTVGRKDTCVACVAIARELAGFVWAIACEATPRALKSKAG